VLDAFQQAIARAARVMSITPLSEAEGAFYPEDPAPYMRAYWYTRIKDRADWSTREHARRHQQDVQASRELLSPHLQQTLAEPFASDFATAQTFLTKECLVGKLMEEYDVLLTPTVPILPWGVDGQGPEGDWNCFTYPANMVNLAAGSLNCGWHTSTDGKYCIPIGMQVMVADRGVPYQNLHTLVRMMAALERCFSHVNTERAFPRFSPLLRAQ
jgi:Asp-tRNA(Asn)/Glu-tRNA(Gln) amidotransferase A subunit family amidase